MAGKKKTQSGRGQSEPRLTSTWRGSPDYMRARSTCYGHKNSGRISVGIYQKDPEILYWCACKCSAGGFPLCVQGRSMNVTSGT